MISSLSSDLIFKIFALIAFAGLLPARMRTLLTYFQQEEYDAPRFRRVMREQRLWDIRFSVSLIVAFVATRLGVSEWAAGLVLLMISFLIVRHENRYHYKKPLVMTRRARRIYTAALSLSGVLVLSALIPQIHPLWILMLAQIQGGFIILVNRFLSLGQQAENAGYIRLGKEKLATVDPVTIGITGSFGKTTTKYLLASALEAAGPVFYSQGSINTVLGLTRHVRQRLQPAHRFFIAEMGAYGIGSIQRLCDFAEPDHGLITSIGAAHMERFGSIETIAQAKSELAEYVLERDGYLLLPHELLEFDRYAVLKADHPETLLTVGERAEADIRIADTDYAEAGWIVALESERFPPGVPIRFTVPLIGDHNIMNAALALSLCVLLAPDRAPDIALNLGDTEQVPHRLQKKERADGVLVLDDAYNSNEPGFRNAIAELRKLADLRGGRAVLITPGLAELGIDHDAVHGVLGRIAGESCDHVIVVGPDRIPTFAEQVVGLRATVETVASLSEANRLLSETVQSDDVVLYENDLPDTLEGRRLL